MIPDRDWSLELSRGDNMRDYYKDHLDYKKIVESFEWNDRQMRILGLKSYKDKK